MLLGTQRIDGNGRLEVGGVDTVRLAEEFGTPLYVIDEDLVRANCRAYREAFDAAYPRHTVCYAGKAFLTTAMCRIVEQEGLNLDVVSEGELYTALRAGFPRKRINLHGNNKSQEELCLAVSAGIGHVVLDNFEEIEHLTDVARAQGRTAAVLVRCTPGVDPHTHRFISTGQADTKFGFNIQDGSALEAVRRVLARPELRFGGIHCHIGSQLLDTEAHEGAVDAMVGVMADIRRETGALCGILNIGGGLGVRYTEDQRPPALPEFARIVAGRLRAALDQRGLPEPTLYQEPGRAIVGEAGLTLYTVGVVKTVPIPQEPGHRTYVTVDGGMSDNPRTQLYDAVYEATVANRAGEPRNLTVTVAGKHCETDVLIWDTPIQDVTRGDILAVQTTGAYNHSMASSYNRFRRPAVVLVSGGRADLIAVRESRKDVVRLDRIPDRLRKRPAAAAAPTADLQAAEDRCST